MFSSTSRMYTATHMVRVVRSVLYIANKLDLVG